MTTKKFFKYTLIGTLPTALILSATLTPPIFLNNQSIQNSQLNNTDFTNQLEYIKNDVQKTTEINDTIASIDLATFYGTSSAAIVTKTDGSTLLYMWGSNQFGQLGFTANKTQNPTPTKVSFFDDKKIIQVIVTSFNSLVLLDKGEVYAWGDNSVGNLGSSSADTHNPVKIGGLLNNKKVIQIGGNGSFAALLNTGEVYMWGSNYSGQLGFPANTTANPTPTKVGGLLNNKKVTQIIVGSFHSVALLDNGEVYTWGLNNFGQLGSSSADTHIPAKVGGLINNKKVTQIGANAHTSAALLDNGEIYMWGRNDVSQLGLAVNSNANPNPAKVGGLLNNKKVTKISMGSSHSAALLDNGEVYTWGSNQFRQIGSTNTASSSLPTKVAGLNGKKVTQINMSVTYSAALLDNGEIYMWGDNQSGQLGFPYLSANIPDPTWLSGLGKPSVILANSEITARQAVENLWVNNVFNLAGFKKSFNLGGIADITGQTITMSKKPTYDSDNGVGIVTMSISIKHFYDENGLKRTNSNNMPMVIRGFYFSLKTTILAKPNYAPNIVVGDFMKLVKPSGTIDFTELSKYLDFNFVPPNVTYDIPNSTTVVDLIKGTIKFEINASNGYESDGITETGEKTPNYVIALQLTPQITKFSNVVNPANLLVTEYYDKVFDGNGKINLIEFNKYTSIIAPVDNAEYFIVPDTWTHHTGDGTLSFKFYASKYYGADGLEKIGSAADDSTHQTINLTLNPLPSSVAVKADYIPTHRADQFMNLLADPSTGVIKDLNLLKQYVDMENIPSTANIIIDPSSIRMDDYDSEQYYTENISFDLMINKFNQTSTTLVAKTIPLTIKLNKAYLETKISAKSQNDYDGNVVVDRLLPQIINKDKVVVDRAKLEEYVNIEALVKDTEIIVDNIVEVYETGVLTFDLIPSLAYGTDSNPIANKVFPITLQLAIRPPQTVIEANDSLVNPERVDIFVNKILSFTNFADLMKYLAPQYVTLAGGFSVPDDQVQFKIENLKYKDIGDLSFDLAVSNTYADGGEVEGFATFPINLKLGQKHAPTKLALIPQYPNGASVTEFIDTVTQAASDQDALKAFLSNFIQGINTIPTTAIISLDILEANETTGMINFILAATTYYDNQSNVINDYRSPTFSLKLVSKDQQDTRTTSVNWKNDVSFPGDAIDFFDQINRNGILNYTQLYKYIIIEHLPVQATISIVNKDAEFDNPMLIQFDVVLTHWYNQGTLKPETTDPEQAKHTPLEKNLFVIGAVSKNSDFQWWWIVLAISGVVLILTTFFIVKHYKQNKKFKDAALAV